MDVITSQPQNHRGHQIEGAVKGFESWALFLICDPLGPHFMPQLPLIYVRARNGGLSCHSKSLTVNSGMNQGA